MASLVVQPGDFCVLSMAPPAGPVVELAQTLQQDVESRRLHQPQRYEHAEVYLGDGLTAAAYPNRHGIRPLTCPPEQVQGALWSSGRIELTTGQRDSIVQWCYDHPNVQYGALDYLALTAHTLGISTAWLQRRIASDKSYICSQYVDAAYLAGSKHLFSDGRWPGFVTPLDLALLLESSPVG
jgi:hypothetical protein